MSNGNGVGGTLSDAAEQAVGPAVVRDEVKPIVAPRHVASDFADGRNINGKIFLCAPTGYVGDGDFAVWMQRRRDDANWSFNLVVARLDPAKMREGDDQTDCSMTAHRQKADVVEKDHTADAGLVRRFNQ